MGEVLNLIDRLNETIEKIMAEKEQLEKEYAELKIKYAELNDFNNSQCAKLLKENEELKERLKEKENG